MHGWPIGIGDLDPQFTQTSLHFIVNITGNVASQQVANELVLKHDLAVVHVVNVWEDGPTKHGEFMLGDERGEQVFYVFFHGSIVAVWGY